MIFGQSRRDFVLLFVYFSSSSPRDEDKANESWKESSDSSASWASYSFRVDVTVTTKWDVWYGWKEGDKRDWNDTKSEAAVASMKESTKQWEKIVIEG